jgi:RNA polymerase sigma factor (sigma-70 family)
MAQAEFASTTTTIPTSASFGGTESVRRSTVAAAGASTSAPVFAPCCHSTTPSCDLTMVTGRPLRASSRRRSDGLGDFAEFYAANGRRLLVYLARRCLDAEVAVDLMAETFAEAFARRCTYRGGSQAEATAWLYGIARRKLADYFRRGRAEQKAVRRLGMRVPALDDAEQARIEELAGLESLRIAVREHFERLSAEQRDAVRLRVVDEMPYSEVARILEVSEQTARARVSRGLRRLALSVDQAVFAGGTPRHE